MKATIRFCENCGQSRESVVRDTKKEMRVKGKKVEIEGALRYCKTCKQNIYDVELDNAFSKKAIAEYNKMHGISSEEIVKLRERYRLTQETLAKILGIAKKTLISYEKGRAAPTQSNLLNLQRILQKHSFLKELAEASSVDLSDDEQSRLEKIPSEELSEYNGYRAEEPERIKQAILYFLEKTSLSTTRIMKGLFYCDFNSFKMRAVSMFGLRYHKYPYGPFDKKVYKYLEALKDENQVDVEDVSTENADFKLYMTTEMNDLSLFDDEEKTIIQNVKQYLHSSNARIVSEESHQEEAWKNTKPFHPISYVHALTLKQDFTEGHGSE